MDEATQEYLSQLASWRAEVEAWYAAEVSSLMTGAEPYSGNNGPPPPPPTKSGFTD